MATSICIVSGRQLFRAGLASILNGDRFQVALQVVRLDDVPGLPWPEGIIIVDKTTDVTLIADELARLKRDCPGCRLVLLADAMDAGELTASFAAGVDGYLLNEISPEALCETLCVVLTGERVVPSSLISLLTNGRALVRRPQHGLSGGARELSERETEVVARLAGGMPNKVIASELTITEATVKVHLKNILKKLRVANRTQVAVWAINNGLAAEGIAHPVSAQKAST